MKYEKKEEKTKDYGYEEAAAYGIGSYRGLQSV